MHGRGEKALRVSQFQTDCLVLWIDPGFLFSGGVLRSRADQRGIYRVTGVKAVLRMEDNAWEEFSLLADVSLDIFLHLRGLQRFKGENEVPTHPMPIQIHHLF